MSDDLGKKTACVVDRGGLFPHIALCLAEQFGQVFYSGPAERMNPKLSDDIVGYGFKNMQRVPSLWGVKDESDVFVFTDVGLTDEQEELVKQGYPVWGHHGADELEVNKGFFFDMLAKLKMPVPPHTVVRGFTKLKEHLWDQEDKFVKISYWRGDWETFHWRNRLMDQTELEIRGLRLGPAREKVVFYVLDKIDTPIEDGIDAWFTGGQWPKRILHAMERKDKSLIGAMQDLADVSDEMRTINEKFGPVLAEYGYQGAFSTEARLADQTFFNDATCRFGSPPSQLQTLMFKNLPAIIYHGAHGEMVEAETPDEIGAQVLITSDREKDEWLAMPLPEELLPFVKSSFCCRVDGVLTIAPNPVDNFAGWLCATGKDIPEVIDRLKELKEMFPEGFDCDLTSLCDLLEELEAAKEKGVVVTDKPIPAPAAVLENGA